MKTMPVIDKKILDKKQEIEAIYFDILRNLKEEFFLDNKEWFFKTEIPESIKEIDTGVGKTYNSAYLALYNLFKTNKRVIISTTRNENVEDLIKEIRKILRKYINIDKLSTIDNDFLMSDKLLGILKIYKLTSYGKQINQEHFNNSRIIITNHSYFFSKGHSSLIASNRKFLKESINENTIIIIDEMDSFEKQAFDSIYINKFVKKNIDLDGICTNKISENAFCTHNGDYYKNNIDILRFQLPDESILLKHDKIGEFDIPKFFHSEKGTHNLRNIINSNFKKMETFEDIGRREGFIQEFPNGKKINILRTALVTRLVKNYDDNGNLEFLKFMDNCHGFCIVKEVIYLTTKKYEDERPDIQIIKKFYTREEFINWCKNVFKSKDSQDQGAINKEYDSFISRIVKNMPQIYKEILVFRRKSILQDLDCKKYYITATPGMLEDLGYHIEKSNYKNKCSLNQIDIYFYDRQRDADKFVFNKALELTNKNINVLAFLTLKKNLDSFVKEIKNQVNKNINLDNAMVVTSYNENTAAGKTIITPNRFALNKNNTHGIMDILIILAYLNGTESTGKNYDNTDLLEISARVEENILNRIAITANYIKIIDIDKITARTVKQAAGRIERTIRDSQKYKAIIIFGEYLEVAEILINSKKGNGIKYNLITKKQHNNNYNKIIKSIERKIDYYNNGNTEINLNIDNRKKVDTYEELGNFYYDLIYNKKMSEKDAKFETMKKFNIKRRQFYVCMKMLGNNLKN